MDHPFLTWRPDLVLINKKKRTCHLVDFAILVDDSENKRKKKDKQRPGSCLRAEKTET